MLTPPASLWWDTLPAPVTARAALSMDLQVDVAIVGGGFTGLWTALELLEREPSIRVAVLERSVCGFGASGRNGGWASALFPVSDDALIARYGASAHAQLLATLRRSVGDLGTAAADAGIDAHFIHGGSLRFARSELQSQRLQDHVARSRSMGFSSGDLEWLDAAAAGERGHVAAALGATFTPHCARLHPARLVRGLAERVIELGGVIFEDTTVTKISAAQGGRSAAVHTVAGTVRAEVVVRATEGFTPTLPGLRREVAPIYSLMIATEPLPGSFWARAGFSRHETFADDRHLIIYGQRTNDDRIAFGGRGAPYHFASAVEPRFDHHERVFALLEATLRELCPDLPGRVTHQWGGPLAMPRDLCPAVRVDRRSGLASAGGYTGDGVVLSRVSAQALADLITDPDGESEFTRLPFVQRHSRRWEVEPLRWTGVNVGLSLASHADWFERTRGREGRSSRWLDRLYRQAPT